MAMGAVPARRGVWGVVQPNGDSLHIQLTGDEWKHAYYTADGIQIKQNEKGWWLYEGSKWRKAHDTERRSCCEKHWIEKHANRMPSVQHNCPMRIVPGDPRNQGMESEMIATDRARRAATARAEAQSNPAIGTLTLTPRVPVILVNFANWSFSTTRELNDSTFNATLFHGTNVTPNKTRTHGSVAGYLHDQSLGQYHPQFDVIGPVTLSQGYAYYGAGKGTSARAGEMIQEACTLVDDSVDFSLYDSDNDGYIDLVFVMYAGLGENDGTYIDPAFGVTVSDLVWPHYSTTSSSTLFDGKRLRAYECSNELDGYFSHPDYLVEAGIGVLCHEFGHGMGLPDVYTGTTQYMGTWSLMDYGCYNYDTYVPSPFTGYERWFCGWSSPKLLNTAANDTLAAISETGEFAIITADGTMPSGPHDGAYYVLENHQKSGWDKYAAGAGMIVYRMQYHSGWSHANSGIEGYILKPADGQLRYYNSGYYVGKAGDCYPTASTSFAPTETADYPVTDIEQLSDGRIAYRVMGGVPAGTENSVAPTDGVRKILQNGHIVIVQGDQTYDILGR